MRMYSLTAAALQAYFDLYRNIGESKMYVTFARNIDTYIIYYIYYSLIPIVIYVLSPSTSLRWGTCLNCIDEQNLHRWIYTDSNNTIQKRLVKEFRWRKNAYQRFEQHISMPHNKIHINRKTRRSSRPISNSIGHYKTKGRLGTLGRETELVRTSSVVHSRLRYCWQCWLTLVLQAQSWSDGKRPDVFQLPFIVLIFFSNSVCHADDNTASLPKHTWSF